MAIIIGYSEQKHYKLYDLKQTKIVWSRDPTILEGKFLGQNQTDLANQKPGIKRSTKLAESPIKRKIARYTSKSTSLSTSRSASKPTKQATKQIASKEAALAADLSHKIEIQILSLKSINKDSEDIYTILDTLLAYFMKTIINNQPTDYILSVVTSKEPSIFN